MESISIFDILKIGVGPSSSHTMGPWRAMQMCLNEFTEKSNLDSIKSIHIHLYGSLAKTGAGHGTNKAIILALLGYDPVTINCEKIDAYLEQVDKDKKLALLDEHLINFNPAENIVFNRNEQLDFHSNALKVVIKYEEGQIFEEIYYSIGGGFVVKGPIEETTKIQKLPFPIEEGDELLYYCKTENRRISDIVMKNELAWRSESEIKTQLQQIIDTMIDSVYRGCHSPGILPGGLNVKRRAAVQNVRLLGSAKYKSRKEWLQQIIECDQSFTQTLNWVSCFALAVNEENAAFGRVVTAPTNGAAGVIPAVMLYHLCFCKGTTQEDLQRFLLVAGELGSIFKKGATISAAMGGCQAEIGVSSAMAAGALTEVQGGSPKKVLMAAEIAMEHHLGLTCDPIGGLVQVPCIERNAMGAMKAITASQIALANDPFYAKVSLDKVIKTMWNTAKDMNSKYKETAEGGLAINIPVSVPDC